jgi:hypothetical protein
LIEVFGAMPGWAADPPARIGTPANVSTRQSSDVVPAGFHSISSLHDNVVDAADALSPPNYGYPNDERIEPPRTRIGERCHIKMRRFHGWYYYIRGHGPVVWVRNRPICDTELSPGMYRD